MAPSSRRTVLKPYRSRSRKVMQSNEWESFASQYPASRTTTQPNVGVWAFALPPDSAAAATFDDTASWISAVHSLSGDEVSSFDSDSIFSEGSAPGGDAGGDDSSSLYTTAS